MIFNVKLDFAGQCFYFLYSFVKGSKILFEKFIYLLFVLVVKVYLRKGSLNSA